MEKRLLNTIQSLSPYEIVIDDNCNLTKDLGFDSLKIVELIFQIEQNYNIEFDDNDLNFSSIKTVGDLKKILQRYVK